MRVSGDATQTRNRQKLEEGFCFCGDELSGPAVIPWSCFTFKTERRADVHCSIMNNGSLTAHSIIA